ncbi:MAG: hypothetical protein JW768_06535 [Chitinispirillaceae bacterium]|nr:hypothetical protein [Chitinispirillaceae bacterium]
MSIRPSVFLAAIVCWCGITMADESDITIIPSGFAYYQIGQIQKMTPNDGSLIEKAFDQHFNGRLTLNAIVRERLKIILGIEAEYGANLNDFQQKKSVLLKEAQGIYSFGDPENSYLQIAAGYFPFKYNPEAKNLGEYLVRSGAYPCYVISDFDFAKIRLMGFHVSSTLFDNLRLNLLFTSEYAEPPFFDYSLSFVAGYKFLMKMIDFGAGINLNRMIPINPDETTFPSNLVTDEQGNYVIENGDTLRYTKKGVKVIGRLTIDPKPVLPFADMMGPDDGKIYGEIAILGVKNYGADYPKMTERMPFMLGMNIPCFNIIDVVAAEMEYFGTDRTKLYNIPRESTRPNPTYYPEGEPRSFYKWSVFGQKTIVKGLALKGLIGRDHFRSRDAGGNYDPIERMNGPGDWHYKLRIMYSF